MTLATPAMGRLEKLSVVDMGHLLALVSSLEVGRCLALCRNVPRRPMTLGDTSTLVTSSGFITKPRREK